MWKRYQLWAGASPLWVWFLTVAVTSGLASLVFLVPGQRHDGLDFLLVGIVLSSPTVMLNQRFTLEERQARPVPPSQERGISLFAALVLFCSVAAFSLATAARHLGGPINVTGRMLMVFSISALLSLGLAYPVRYTKGGQWVLRLAVGWLALIVLAAIVGVVRRALIGS